MKHIILGGGNLGKDLLIEMNSLGVADPELWTNSRGKDVRMIADVVAEINHKMPECVWYCVGAGSVNEAKHESKHYSNSVILHRRVPLALAKYLDPKIKLVLFSTDYVADETRPTYPFAQTPKFRSNYAALKGQMENEIQQMQRPFTTVVRVGSLYGVHKPEQTFPGKILKNFNGKEGIQLKGLPQNLVVPTPTRWLANVLLRNFDKLCLDSGATREHVAPEGATTVIDWGKFVLAGMPDVRFNRRDENTFYYDEERPLVSGLGNTLETSAHWHELWQVYFRKEWFLPK